MSKLIPLSLAVSLLVSACAQDIERPPSSIATRTESPTTQPSRTDMHASFDALLKRHVRREKVDYLTLRDQDSAVLTAYLDRLAEVKPEKLGEKARLAFYINLYNASMIQAVVDRYVSGYSPAADKFAVFDAPIVRTGGKTIALNQLENEIIRKQFAEPRIHVALVCGARACPPLLPRAYRADDLDQLLDSGMKRFVNDASRNTLGEKKVALSKIFEWYGSDFGSAGVLAYIRDYAKLDVSKAELGYREYVWDLNLLAPMKGEWVKLKQAVGGMSAGAVHRVLSRADGKVELFRAVGGAVKVPSASVAAQRF